MGTFNVLLWLGGGGGGGGGGREGGGGGGGEASKIKFLLGMCKTQMQVDVIKILHEFR